MYCGMSGAFSCRTRLKTNVSLLDLLYILQNARKCSIKYTNVLFKRRKLEESEEESERERGKYFTIADILQYMKLNSTAYYLFFETRILLHFDCQADIDVELSKVQSRKVRDRL